MKVFSIAKGFHYAWKHTPPELLQRELDRLRAINVWQEIKDIALVLWTFGISRATLYRRLKQFDPKDLSSLKEKTRRPKNQRKPRWNHDLVIAVRQLRRQYPRWGKEKLFSLLKEKGWQGSESTVGWIIVYLKRRGEIVEPKTGISVSRKRRPIRPYAVRKPKDYAVSNPGDLVQVDTLDIRPLPNIVLKQFTSRDTVSKWDVLEVRSRATARTAREFLNTLCKTMPFKIKAIQVDGGSEFEEACKQMAIKLFVLPPKSPKLNGSVERANRTHAEEFYEVNDCSWTVPDLNKQLRHREYVYNCIRPHHSLGLKTPLQFLKEYGIIRDNNPSGSSNML